MPIKCLLSVCCTLTVTFTNSGLTSQPICFCNMKQNIQRSRVGGNFIHGNTKSYLCPHTTNSLHLPYRPTDVTHSLQWLSSFCICPYSHVFYIFLIPFTFPRKAAMDLINSIGSGFQVKLPFQSIAVLLCGKCVFLQSQFFRR